MTPTAAAQFRKAVEDMTESWLWELANQAQNRIPDPVDYVEMRRKTFGSDLTMSLCRLGHGRRGPAGDLPDAARCARWRTRPPDYACLLNDVFSYQKEIEFEGEVHNGVLVVQNFFDCDYPTGLAIVDDLMTSRMRQFQHIVAHELPVLFDDLDLGEEARGTSTATCGSSRTGCPASSSGTATASATTRSRCAATTAPSGPG